MSASNFLKAIKKVQEELRNFESAKVPDPDGTIQLVQPADKFAVKNLSDEDYASKMNERLAKKQLMENIDRIFMSAIKGGR